ncbi:hypothetical protein V6N11_049223 [Hibiscus sabdariffa]|uniref:RNase H type-1 domain-containing protein n=1 Tax=Hibiscus sabdariffa TaxID=183260 RepID=A0ABR2NK68_9ROSI
MTKINFDASSFQSQQISIFGIVVRDEYGYMLVHGLSFVVDLGLQSLVLEGVARAIITKLATPTSDCYVIGPIITSAKALQGHFACFRFHHTTRSANQATYTLARERLISTHDRFWIEDVPSLVMVLVAVDRRSLDPP